MAVAAGILARRSRPPIQHQTQHRHRFRHHRHPLRLRLRRPAARLQFRSRRCRSRNYRHHPRQSVSRATAKTTTPMSRFRCARVAASGRSTRTAYKRAFFRGVAKTLVALDAAANSILAGSLPGSSLSGFIPEWEATLGLPDPCAGDAPTVQQRCDQIRARFVGGGGQSRQHYLDMAKTLGFTITITNFFAVPGRP
ncbi:putative phage tail protein [Sphingomonas sp. Ant H11]|uniref:putative phage tail protein n=1 Tax=Sphingomonas sp. Ant H11 TaxID=1564113 RepID=UPI003FA7344F